MTKTTKARKLEAYPEIRKKRWYAGIILAAFSVLFLLCTGAAQRAQANSPWQSPPPTVTTLYNFTQGNDGSNPDGGLVADSSGNLFGVTYSGTVFELPCSGTPCTYPSTPKLLYTAEQYLEPTGLTIDSSGNLYGITFYGTVFELPCSGTPCAYPSLKLSQPFNAFSQGRWLNGPLVADSSGNLYATAAQGGSTSCSYTSAGSLEALGCGTVVKLSPPTGSGTQYTVSVLHTFTGADGAGPMGGLVLDQSTGTLYGTTFGRGSGYDGTVFKLSPPTGTDTGYSLKVLHSFSGLDGANPAGGVMMDSSGNLYGTTTYGGSDGDGTVFELSPDSGAATGYTERVLFSFADDFGDYPVSRLLMDSFGNLYGTTYSSGWQAEGGVFKFDPSSGTMTVLGAFASLGATIDRTVLGDLMHYFPLSMSGGVVMGPSGNLYGTTFLGGSGCWPPDCGTAFEVPYPDGEAEALITQVNALLTAQVINQGQDGSLVGELQQAIQMIDANKLHGAIGNFESFITEVDDLENSGVLTSDQAASLVNIANAAIEQLQALL